jgi:hypothetical protein
MKKLIVLLVFFIAAISVKAQEELEPVKGFDKSKLFVGGNFALNFGNITILNVSPQLGYRFNRFLAAGVGINGQYSAFKSEYVDGSTASRESYGVVGFNIFGRVYPIEQVLIQVQPEINNVWGKRKDYYYNPSSQVESKLSGKLVPSLLVGAGGALPAGRGAFIIMAQYDVLQNNRTPYGDKIFFNFGYNVGL